MSATPPDFKNWRELEDFARRAVQESRRPVISKAQRRQMVHVVALGAVMFLLFIACPG